MPEPSAAQTYAEEWTVEFMSKSGEWQTVKGCDSLALARQKVKDWVFVNPNIETRIVHRAWTREVVE